MASSPGRASGDATVTADEPGSRDSLLEALADLPPAAVALLPGTVLGGRFRIEQRLGAGGMGVVYCARDTQLMRDVAIKLHSGPDADRDRLLREAVAMAQLQHPNVVTIYEVGPYEHGIFIAMELVEGTTMRGWLSQATRRWREILQAYLEAGKGLAAIHRASLVHRDFKPDNVLIGDDGRVRVSDLGLARAAAETQAPSVPSSPNALAGPLTLAGGYVGTPGYSAPEQIGGARVDARADQYAFCVALHEGLFAARPGRPPASGRRVPRWVRRALARGLAADPAARYPTLDALLRALSLERWRWRRRLVAGTLAAGALVAAAAWSVARRERACEFSDQEREALWGTSAARGVEAAFVATRSSSAPQAFAHVDRSLRAYADAWQAQRVEACRAARVTRSQSEEMFNGRTACLQNRRAALRGLVAVLAEADPAAVENSASAAARLPELSRCADAEYVLAKVKPPDSAIAPDVERVREAVTQAVARFRAGHYRAAEMALQPLVVEVERLQYLPIEADVHYALGLVQSWSEQPAAAPPNLRRAYFAARRSGHDETAALAAIELVGAYGYELLRFDLAGEWADLGRAEVERSAKGTRLEADLHVNLGLFAERQGRSAEALAHYRQALTILRRLGEGEGYLAARLHTHIGAELDRQGRFGPAIAAYGESLALRARILSASHPDNVNTLALLAIDQVETGRPEVGLYYAVAALAIAESGLGRHPKTGLSYLAMAGAVQELGAGEAAVRLYETALEIFEATRPPDHPNVALAHMELGGALARAGRAVEAVEHARRAHAIYQKALGDEHAVTAISLSNTGKALLAAGRPVEAHPLLERAVAVLLRVRPEGQGMPEALATLGRCLVALDRRAEAASHIARALRVARAQSLSPRFIADTQAVLDDRKP